MQFQRLRLAGFKSFAEPTELRIEPGLTGVVGPNGCGKSNLLEALRWVMGANSARAMRAGGMDDVIFGGAAGRPARNHAEVSLQVDNSERRAPAPFNDHAVIEVTRRIDRGAGSTFRVNGTEVRARDVQLLFSDASTGANSPALVRQGQISELIAAKPANRRKILEEAAGVSGLYARRHEAHLKLSAAEENLARLGDVSREIEGGLERLQRDARQAAAYRQLSGEIRTLKATVHRARWREAEAALAEAEAELAAADRDVERGAHDAARAAAAALAAAEAVKPLREEVAVASAVLQRLAIARDRLERAEQDAEAERARLMEAEARNLSDRRREAQIEADAMAALERLRLETAELETAIAAEPDALPALAQALEAAGAARVTAEAEIERLAAETARREALGVRRQEAALRASQAAARVAEAETRLARIQLSLDELDAERAALADRPADSDDGARLVAAQAELRSLREAVERAERARAAAREAEGAAHGLARKAEDDLRRLKAEAEGLSELLAPAGKAAFPSALEQVRVAEGLEGAVAAALGEDLDAALDARAPAFWGPASEECEALPVHWPQGAEPLSPLVQAPDALAARLALTALVDRAEGPLLQAFLPVGARLVSREGDLWRWDGFTSRAEAPRPAARRLAQQARLREIEHEAARLASVAADASARHTDAADRLGETEAALAAARTTAEAAERGLATAQEAAERQRRAAARQEARIHALDDTARRLAGEAADAEAALERARREAREATDALQVAAAEAESPPSGDTAALDQARRALAAASETEARARSSLQTEASAREGRLSRREALEREQSDWAGRRAVAAERLAALEAEQARLAAAVTEARGTPDALVARRRDLEAEFAAAERRAASASEALALGEAASDAGEHAVREAEHAVAAARERRAGGAARLQAAQAARDAAHVQLREQLGSEPDPSETAAASGEAGALEARIATLERRREMLGAVNLRAEEESHEQAARLEAHARDRDDLAAAVAKLRSGIEALNGQGRDRLAAAFEVINGHFRDLFAALFEGGQADLRLAESDDPLEAGLEIYACPPGKRLASMSLLSGGEQALTAAALIFAVFLANPAPVCVLDELDAPLDDANVDRFCRLLDEMRRRTDTRFIVITHNPVTMSRMDRLFGVTMRQKGVSQLVSVDLRQAEALAAQ